jgi:hypothetical protein
MAWLRISFGIIIILLSGVGAYFAGGYKEQIETLVGLAATVFAIFSGFSITIISIVGGLDSVLASFSWKQLQAYEQTFHAKILRQAILCALYSLALCLSLAIIAVGKEHSWHLWLSRGFVFISLVSLFSSLILPFTLCSLYRQRYELLMQEKGAPKIK